MAITSVDFEAISERDLIQMKEDQVAEGLTLDYKRDAYACSEDGKRELLKNVSSFINTAGGHIVLGMDEVGGLPTDLRGLSLDLDAEMQRLENLFRTCLEPRVVGLRMRPVPLTNGSRALAMRLPKSWNPPHAVLFKGSRRYFARNSSGAHEASVEELRAIFTMNAAVFDRIQDFHRRRQIVVHTGKVPVQMNEPQFVLHVIPYVAFEAGFTVDLPSLNGRALTPIWHSRLNEARYNFDGYLTTSGTGGRAGYVQVHRNGIIETAAGGIADTERRISVEDVEDQIAKKLEQYLNALRFLEVPPPLAVLLAGVRMHGIAIAPRSPPSATPPLQTEHDMFFPPVIIDDYGDLESYRRTLKPGQKPWW
jgi:hypothetical protein